MPCLRLSKLFLAERSILVEEQSFLSPDTEHLRDLSSSVIRFSKSRTRSAAGFQFLYPMALSGPTVQDVSSCIIGESMIELRSLRNHKSTQ
jgi:hypothetical protein